MSMNTNTVAIAVLSDKIFRQAGEVSIMVYIPPVGRASPADLPRQPRDQQASDDNGSWYERARQATNWAGDRVQQVAGTAGDAYRYARGTGARWQRRRDREEERRYQQLRRANAKMQANEKRASEYASAKKENHRLKQSARSRFAGDVLDIAPLAIFGSGYRAAQNVRSAVGRLPSPRVSRPRSQGLATTMRKTDYDFSGKRARRNGRRARAGGTLDDLDRDFCNRYM
jgi:hypothetical protein